MILVIIRMKALPGKRKEFSQTFVHYRFYQEGEGMQALRRLPEYRG